MADPKTLLLLIGCKASLILAIVASLVAWAGRRWPFGCSTWQRIGVAALLILPPAVCLLPSIQIPILPASEPAIEVRDGNRPVISTERSSRVDSDSDWADSDLSSLYVDSELTAHGAATQLSISSVHVNQTDYEFSTRRQSKDLISDDIRSNTDPNILFACLALIYGTVLTAYLVRLVLAVIGLRRLRTSSSLVTDAEWQALLGRWTTTLGVRRFVELRTSPEATVPMTFGWRSPIILIPQQLLSSCDRSQREVILVHELTHVAHGDFLWQILVRLMAAIYWIHPLAWIVRREAESLHERLSDLQCSRHLGREKYSLALIGIAARCRRLPTIKLGMAMTQRQSLRRRLDELASNQGQPNPRSGRARSVVICATAVLALGGIVISVLSERVSTGISRPEAVVESDHREGALQHRHPSLTEDDSTSAPSSSVQDGTHDGSVGFALSEPTFPVSFISSGLLNKTQAVAPQFHVVAFDLGRQLPTGESTTTFVYGIIQDPEWPQFDARELEKETELFKAKVAAVVNGDPILNGDILDRFCLYLKHQREEIVRTTNSPLHLKPDQLEPNADDYKKILDDYKNRCEQYFKNQAQIVQREIAVYVQRTALSQYLMAQLTPEQVAETNARLDQMFVETTESIRRELKVDSINELELELRARGTSLQKIKQNFVRERLAMECIALNCKPSASVEDLEIDKNNESHMDEKLKEELEFARRVERHRNFIHKVISEAKIETEYAIPQLATDESP